jgi:hypothetical protein
LLGGSGNVKGLQIFPYFSEDTPSPMSAMDLFILFSLFIRFTRMHEICHKNSCKYA